MVATATTTGSTIRSSITVETIAMASHRRPPRRPSSFSRFGQVAMTIMLAHTIAPTNGRRIQRHAKTSRPMVRTLSVARARSEDGGVLAIDGMISFQLARRSMRFKQFVPAVVCAALVLLARALSAQTIGGTLEGTVTDPSGAVVQRAQVVVANLATGDSRTLTTD